MSRKTHFSEAEIERLVEIHKNALVQYRSFLSYNIWSREDPPGDAMSQQELIASKF